MWIEGIDDDLQSKYFECLRDLSAKDRLRIEYQFLTELCNNANNTIRIYTSHGGDTRLGEIACLLSDLEGDKEKRSAVYVESN